MQKIVLLVNCFRRKNVLENRVALVLLLGVKASLMKSRDFHEAILRESGRSREGILPPEVAVHPGPFGSYCSGPLQLT